MSLGQGNIIRQQKKETGAAPTVTAANNGLSLSGTTVQLGATAFLINPLLHNSYIDTAGFGLFIGTTTALIVPLTVSSNSNIALSVSSTSSGAIYATAPNGAAVTGISTNQTGGIFQSTNSVGMSATSQGTWAGAFTMLVAATNTEQRNVRLYRQTTGTATDGIGQYIEFLNEDGAGNSSTANKITSLWSTAAAATRTSQFKISGIDTAVEKTILTLNGNQSIKLNGYGGGTISGTPAYALAVDATGNIIETAVSSGGIATADNGLNLSTATNVQLGGPFTITDTLIGDAATTAIAISQSPSIVNGASGSMSLATVDGSSYGSIYYEVTRTASSVDNVYTSIEAYNQNGTASGAILEMEHNAGATSTALLRALSVSLGDTTNSGNETKLTIHDGNKRIEGMTDSTVCFFLDKTTNQFFIGELAKGHLTINNTTTGPGPYLEFNHPTNGTNFTINDNLKTFLYEVNSADYLSLDATNKLYGIGDLSAATNSTWIKIDDTNNKIVTKGDSYLRRTETAFSNGAAAQVATMTNGPTAGNPTKWIPIDDNGTTRYMPAW